MKDLKRKMFFWLGIFILLVIISFFNVSLIVRGLLAITGLIVFMCFLISMDEVIQKAKEDW
jgi:hypothetical protein